MKPRCVCGCGWPGVHKHHAITRQELRRWAPTRKRAARKGDGRRTFSELEKDPRNLVLVAFHCHLAHHDASKHFRLHMLPDSVFEFAEELMGPGPAYEYLRRHYDGSDMRLEFLLAKSCKRSGAVDG